uniref:Uncharacterized protein n=1 Tax=Arundo donax TaxID=35708 RepID=A0A0A9BS61_ARUDO
MHYFSLKFAALFLHIFFLVLARPGAVLICKIVTHVYIFEATQVPFAL